MHKNVYTPWETEDEYFHSIYSGIMTTHTLVEIERCWELWNLVHQVAHIEGIVLEVGCWKGGSGLILAQAASRVDQSIFVYLCDTFAGTVKGGEIDGQYWDDGQFKQATFEGVHSLVTKYNLQNCRILEGVFPDETGQHIEGEKIRLCHIDVDTYQSVKDIYEWVWPRLSIGGILVYDDYGNLPTPGIRKHVNEIRYGTDRVFIYNLNEHAILIRMS